MSGGALDYAGDRIHDVVRSMGTRDLTPKMRTFRVFLERVAVAVHDIEWELSGDYGPGDSDSAIDAVLPNGFDLLVAIEEADAAAERLDAAIKEAKKAAKP